MHAVETSEVALARALLSGRAEAFEAFVEAFRTRIFQYSYFMCGHREDAEEVAQDTLLKVFQNLSSLREPEKVRSWVFRIAKNACLMKRRRSIYAPDHELSIDDLNASGGSDDLRDPGSLPDEQVLRSERAALLARGMQSLHPHYRSVILLRDIEGLSTEETAEVLDLSTDAVKQRLHRARSALRRALENENA